MEELVALDEEEADPGAKTEEIETGEEAGKDLVLDLPVADATEDPHLHKPLNSRW